MKVIFIYNNMKFVSHLYLNPFLSYGRYIINHNHNNTCQKYLVLRDKSTKIGTHIDNDVF